jgi:hypothetical protein
MSIGAGAIEILTEGKSVLFLVGGLLRKHPLVSY